MQQHVLHFLVYSGRHTTGRKRGGGFTLADCSPCWFRATLQRAALALLLPSVRVTPSCNRSPQSVHPVSHHLREVSFALCFVLSGWLSHCSVLCARPVARVRDSEGEWCDPMPAREHIVLTAVALLLLLSRRFRAKRCSRLSFIETVVRHALSTAPRRVCRACRCYEALARRELCLCWCVATVSKSVCDCFAIECVCACVCAVGCVCVEM